MTQDLGGSEPTLDSQPGSDLGIRREKHSQCAQGSPAVHEKFGELFVYGLILHFVVCIVFS